AGGRCISIAPKAFHCANVNSVLPVRESQKRSPSRHAPTTILPQGINDTERTHSLVPTKSGAGFPVNASNTAMPPRSTTGRPSKKPPTPDATSCLPSLENASQRTSQSSKRAPLRELDVE